MIDVGSYPPNPAGIYDLRAGIREWVNDWYDAKYYSTSPQQQPKGPKTGNLHVLRGYFGSDTSAMSIKRWVRDDGAPHGVRSPSGESHGHGGEEVFPAKYSGPADATFCCVLNR
ncbi:formylglycine-generating enzyme family protein [Duganella callida]|uniref:Sulfatase-modifying factor enzyme-like domain-containing protein n=1 Tax=Duganella callida TaxID=2561932 RepID=A0A4Y9SUC5_9BURK|nr:hypothetical protein E4L98_05055 [Duganella callida]